MSHGDLGVGATHQEARQRLERIAALLDAKQEWLRRWTVPLLVSVVALIVAGLVSEPLIMALMAAPLVALSLQLRNRKALERARDANRAVVAAVESDGRP